MFLRFCLFEVFGLLLVFIKKIRIVVYVANNYTFSFSKQVSQEVNEGIFWAVLYLSRPAKTKGQGVGIPNRHANAGVNSKESTLNYIPLPDFVGTIARFPNELPNGFGENHEFTFIKFPLSDNIESFILEPLRASTIYVMA